MRVVAGTASSLEASWLGMAEKLRRILFLIVLAAGYAGLAAGAVTDGGDAAIDVPTGKQITPTAAAGAILQDLNPELKDAPDLRAGRAAAVSVSPDCAMLAILTSGYNLHYDGTGKVIPALSTEFVFFFDISEARPKKRQVFPVPNSFQGLAWAPSSDRLFVSGGVDDAVLEFVRTGTTFAAGRTLRLGHQAGVGLGLKFDGQLHPIRPMVAGLAVSPDGTRLLTANLENDSVSMIDLKSGQKIAEQDLRPGIIDPKHRGESGGSFPRCVTWTATDRAYVGSERDREIVSLAVTGNKIKVLRRIAVHGQPVALLANRKGTRLYAALDNTDQLAVVDTSHDAVIGEFSVVAPDAVYSNGQKLGGVNADALALTPDEGTLLVGNGGENAIAVVRLSSQARGVAPTPRKSPHRDDDDDDERPADRGRSAIIGLVPTGWYPTGVAVSKDGATWYAVNAKSETGPNVGWCQKVDPARGTCVLDTPAGTDIAVNGQMMLRMHDQATLQMQKAGLLSFPAPSPIELARLTKQVARNNHLDNPEISARDEKLFSFLREHIHHVIYIVKENRTYDQILGDAKTGNGDPRLTIFPQSISPNHHAIARNFVTLDNLFASGEGSWTGWDWSVAARTNDFTDRGDPMSLAGRGFDGTAWGTNRNINMAYATSAERKANFSLSPSDPDILPGTHSVAALDGPGGEEAKGYIWDAVLRRGLTVRNYGFLGHMTIEFTEPRSIPYVHDPFAQKLRVFTPSNGSLKPFTDPYFREWNPAFPDFWRYREWKREFDEFSKAGVAPNLMLVRLGNDHLGDFDKAIDGVNTPEAQMADNDYAIGLVIEAVADSPFAKDTLVVTIEDDTWDGPDHVDSFRTVALVAGPYVRQHAVVSTRYTTVSVIKTIEEVLGTGPIGLNDALAAPMSDVFDAGVTTWSYKAIVPDILRSTKLPLSPDVHAHVTYPRHSVAYWAKQMAGQDFSGPDRADPITFNRALWQGLKGDEPFPKLSARARRRPVNPNAKKGGTDVSLKGP
jgi:DNA-binding beta-propeller fold protein YncE